MALKPMLPEAAPLPLHGTITRHSSSLSLQRAWALESGKDDLNMNFSTY